MSVDWLASALLSLPQAPAPGRYRTRDGSVSAAACKAAGVSRSTLWQRLNPDRVDKARKASQAREWREQTMRPAWLAYCDAYRLRWPGGTPVGFGRWLADGHYRAWLDGRVFTENTRTKQSARLAIEGE